MFKRKISLLKWQVKLQILKLALLAPVQRRDKECYERMSLKFVNNVENHPENSVSISGIKYLQVGQIKPHLGTFYQSLWALILSCSQLSAGLASLLLVLWGAGPFPNPGEKGKSAVSVQGTLQCLASAASRTQFPASPLSRHQR